MEYFNLLPEEITLDIISRLPTESALGCKLVSTTWRSLVRHPSFSKMHSHRLNHPAAAYGKMGFIALTCIVGRIHYNLQYFDYDENQKLVERIRRVKFNIPLRGTSFLGSYNGLICFSSREKTCICNPITREYILLPKIKGVAASGFGYVSSTNEYKVVRIVYENETKFMEVHVYTLGSGNGWRNIGKFNFGTTEHWGVGEYLNGSLYWIVFQSEMIIPFDCAEEKFGKHISLPENEFSVGYLGVLDGCLSFASSRRVIEDGCWDVWLLKNKDDNHGMKEREGHQSLGWSEEFEVSESEEFRVLDSEIFAVTKSCDVLIFDYNHINVYNPEASTWKRIVDFKEQFRVVFPHKNTLVSLKELGEEDTKIMESVEIEETESHAQPFRPAVGG